MDQFDFYVMLKQNVACRPVVKGTDDASNFDDYSSVKPMQEMRTLSAADQLQFADF